MDTFVPSASCVRNGHLFDGLNHLCVRNMQEEINQCVCVCFYMAFDQRINQMAKC